MGRCRFSSSVPAFRWRTRHRLEKILRKFQQIPGTYPQISPSSQYERIPFINRWIRFRGMFLGYVGIFFKKINAWEEKTQESSVPKTISGGKKAQTTREEGAERETGEQKRKKEPKERKKNKRKEKAAMIRRFTFQWCALKKVPGSSKTIMGPEKIVK